MATKGKALPQGITEDQLQELVKKHGPLTPISVKHGGEVVTGLFKKPTLQVIATGMKSFGDDQIGMGQFLYDNCKVAVDPLMDTSDEVKVAAIRGVSGLFKMLEVEVGEAYA